MKRLAFQLLQTIFPCCFPKLEAIRVAEISENEIQDLAEHMTTHVMERLGLGILGGAPIPDRFNDTTDGRRFPVIGTRYDPNSGRIVFDRYESMNGANVGHTEISLREASKSVSLHFLTAFEV